MSLEHSLERQRRPRYGKIRAAVAYAGAGRTKLYELAAENPGLFVKLGTATLVNLDRLDQILDRLPAAQIRGPKDKVAS